MKRLIVCALLLVGALEYMCAQSLNPAYIAYIERWKGTALIQEQQYGIPAAITLAQGLLESGAGQSTLATQANNHFGIKCHQDWQGGTFNKDDDKKNECFRAYEKADDSFRDHSLFLKRKRYESLFTYPISDYRAWANGLKACGYATDPSYPEKLIRIIETYDLTHLDGGVLATADGQDGGKSASSGNQSTAPSGNQSTAPSGRGRRTDGGSATVAEASEQAATDSVRWKPTHMHTNALYAEHLFGKTNGQRFLVAQEGDTWGSIAYLLGMEEKTLRRINEVPDKQQLRGGDRIYLFRKRSKAAKQTPRHLVKQGETAWDIAQYYGITVKSLYKRNGIAEGTPLTTQQYLDLR